MNQTELINKVTSDIAKDRNISEDEVSTYSVVLRLADMVVKNCSIPYVVGRSEQYCDDNEVTHNRYRLHDGFAYCPDCGEEL